MQFKQNLFLTIFIAVIALAYPLSFSNPLFSSSSLSRVLKNKARKILSGVEGNVRRMQIKDPFSSTLLRGHPAVDMPTLDKDLKLQNSVNWTACDSSKQIIEIKSLTFGKLSFPGPLNFSFDVMVHESIARDEDITAVVELKYQARSGLPWIRIPCAGGLVGSCTYKDICDKLASLSCPDIIKRGGRCNCPFAKGEYKMKPYVVEVDAEVFINGNYKAKANLTSASKGPLGCYNLAFSILD